MFNSDAHSQVQSFNEHCKCFVFVLLDLSASFDTVNHSILLRGSGSRYSKYLWVSSGLFLLLPVRQLQFIIMPHQLNLCFVAFPKLLSWAQ